MEVPIQHILCDVLRILCSPRAAMVAVLDGGLDVFLATDPQNPLVINMDVMVMAKVIAAVMATVMVIAVADITTRTKNNPYNKR